MLIAGRQTRTLRRAIASDRQDIPAAIEIIDQTLLPHQLFWRRLTTLDDALRAIRDMQVRGAPLIGVTAAYGLALALEHDAEDPPLLEAVRKLAATRPTAVNLHWALGRMQTALLPLPAAERREAAWRTADALADADADANRAIGAAGVTLLRTLPASGHRRLNLLTHCNAGALATIDWGTALAPIYLAGEAGIEVHVWVSETRPRNQGLLTAWELAQAGIDHTIVCDNAAAWLMANGHVDAVIVGADRIARNGDTANKIGTCLKAWAARGNGIAFYVAAPTSTIDLNCPNGAAIPIEERDGDEVRTVGGMAIDGKPERLSLLPPYEAVANPAFDVTPAGLIDAFITECGVFTPCQLHLAFKGKAGHGNHKDATDTRNNTAQMSQADRAASHSEFLK